MSTRKNESQLRDLLSALTRDPRYKPKLYQKKIESAWKEIMGIWIDRETRSIRIKEGRLTIRIASSSLREELNFMKDKIREKVNTALDEDYVKEVIIK